MRDASTIHPPDLASHVSETRSESYRSPWYSSALDEPSFPLLSSWGTRNTSAPAWPSQVGETELSAYRDPWYSSVPIEPSTTSDLNLSSQLGQTQPDACRNLGYYSEQSTSFIWGTSTISAPQNNLPASSAIRFTEVSVSTDPVENGKRELVRLLLPLQDIRGKFVSMNEISGVTMTTVLGTDFERLVDGSISDGPLQKLANQMPPSLDIGDIARTAAVLQLLHIHFQGCRDLWQRMDSKATTYLQTTCSALAVTLTELMDHAQAGVANAHFCESLHLNECGQCLLGSRLRIPLHSKTPAAQPASGSRSLDLNLAFVEPGIEAAGTEVADVHLTEGDPSSPWPVMPTVSLANEAAQRIESASPSGEPTAAAGFDTSHPAKSKPVPPSGGEKQASTYQPASRMAGSATELPVPSTPVTKVRDADRVEQEHLVRRLAVERERRAGLGSGREVELPDDI